NTRLPPELGGFLPNDEKRVVDDFLDKFRPTREAAQKTDEPPVILAVKGRQRRLIARGNTLEQREVVHIVGARGRRSHSSCHGFNDRQHAILNPPALIFHCRYPSTRK